jgi:hypothetical protein
MAFPVVKCFGVNLFVLRDRAIPVCLEGVAGLDSRSHTNAVKVATSPRACAPSLGAVLGTHLLVLIDIGRPGLESVSGCAVLLVWT